MPELHRLPSHDNRAKLRLHARNVKVNLHGTQLMARFEMTTRLLMICSAAPEGAGFPADEPASGTGLARIRPMAVSADSICLCSPLLRAQQTAAALGLSIDIVPALREADYGNWRGCDPAALLSTDRGEFANWLQDPTAAPHGGESFAVMASRVTGWLEAQAGADLNMVVVTHPGPMQAIVLHVLAAPHSAARAIAIRPFSRIRLTHDGRRWSLRIEA